MTNGDSRCLKPYGCMGLGYSCRTGHCHSMPREDWQRRRECTHLQRRSAAVGRRTLKGNIEIVDRAVCYGYTLKRLHAAWPRLATTTIWNNFCPSQGAGMTVSDQQLQQWLNAQRR